METIVLIIFYSIVAAVVIAIIYAVVIGVKDDQIAEWRKKEGLCKDINLWESEAKRQNLVMWLNHARERVPRVMPHTENGFERDYPLLKDQDTLGELCAELSVLAQASGLVITFHDKLGERFDNVLR